MFFNVRFFKNSNARTYLVYLVSGHIKRHDNANVYIEKTGPV